MKIKEILDEIREEEEEISESKSEDSLERGDA